MNCNYCAHTTEIVGSLKAVLRVRYGTDVLRTALSSSLPVFRYTERPCKAIAEGSSQVESTQMRHLRGYGVRQKGQD